MDDGNKLIVILSNMSNINKITGRIKERTIIPPLLQSQFHHLLSVKKYPDQR